VLAEHPFPDEEIPRCQTCHNPHSPTVEELAAEVPDADAQADIIAEPPAHLTAAIAKCVRCHGKQGQGRRKNPPIAGMESGEFIEKMRNFKAGTGEKTKMDKYAKPLSDEEIVELALYYEGLPASLPEETPE
jgi:cytochrome c553